MRGQAIVYSKCRWAPVIKLHVIGPLASNSTWPVPLYGASDGGNMLPMVSSSRKTKFY